MNKLILTIVLAVMTVSSAMAGSVPSLKVTLNSGDYAEIPLSTIKDVTYQDATTMYVNYTDGTASKSFAISNVKNMVLSTFDASGIETIGASDGTTGYTVYDLQGNVVAKGETADKLPSLDGQKAGVYIVRIGTRTVKVTRK